MLGPIVSFKQLVIRIKIIEPKCGVGGQYFCSRLYIHDVSNIRFECILYSDYLKLLFNNVLNSYFQFIISIVFFSTVGTGSVNLGW